MHRSNLLSSSLHQNCRVQLANNGARHVSKVCNCICQREVINWTPLVVILFCRILVGKLCQTFVSGITNEGACRDGFTQSEGNSKIDPFPEMAIEHSYFSGVLHRNWGFAFTHASTSSKCILFAIQSLVQFNDFVKRYWLHNVKWIVSEMIDWLKVGDSAFNNSRNICNPDNWEEPNSRSPTTG